MTTARDLIKSSLRKLQVLGKGQSLDADEANDALLTLNAMIASWSAERAYIYTITKETFNLSTASSYTIGAGGDFNTTRPLLINNLFTTQGGIDYPATAISNAQYASIAEKNSGNSYSDFYYYKPDYPIATLFLYPAPSGGTITINSYKALITFTTLDTDFELPPEYQAALEYNLAVWLAPEYEREAAPTVKALAHETKQVVLIQNGQNDFVESTSDFQSGNSFLNIYGGWR